MTQSARTTFWEEMKARLELWEEHLKDPITGRVTGGTRVTQYAVCRIPGQMAL